MWTVITIVIGVVITGHFVIQMTSPLWGALILAGRHPIQAEWGRMKFEVAGPWIPLSITDQAWSLISSHRRTGFAQGAEAVVLEVRQWTEGSELGNGFVAFARDCRGAPAGLWPGQSYEACEAVQFGQESGVYAVGLDQASSLGTVVLPDAKVVFMFRASRQSEPHAFLDRVVFEALPALKRLAGTPG